MLDVEQKYKDLYNSYGGKKIRLIFYGEEYYALYPSETLFPSEDLYPAEMDEEAIGFVIDDSMVQTDTLTISESLCSDEDLNFGACECSQMEITVSGLSQNIAGKEFLLTESFGGYEMVMGLYTVDSTPKQGDKDTRKIIAYDRMKRFDADVSGWYNLVDFPISLKDFRKSLCEFVGVPEFPDDLVNDDMVIEKTLDPTSLKGRDMLQYICQINGVFGSINKNGQLQYISVPKKDDVMDEVKVYQSVESEEYSVPDIDTVMIRQEEGDIGGSSVGDGQNVYIIEGNPLVYGKTTSELIPIANNIRSVISGLEYCPASINTNGSPWYEVGDRLKIKTSDGVINTIIMSRTFTGIQGAMDTYKSTGNQELSQPFNIESEIIQIKGLSAILKRTAEEVSNHLTNLEEDTNSKFAQTASEISLKVSKGDVSNQLSVEKDGISIIGNRFSWESTYSSMTSDGKLNATSGTFAGDVTANAFKTSDGSIVLSGGKLTITGAEIKGTANSSTIGCSVLSANAANIGGLTVNSAASMRDISAGDVYCDDIECTQIYSSRAGEWWSDIRFKYDIQSVAPTVAMRIIMGLKPKLFRYKDNGSPGIGFIAQQVSRLLMREGIDLPIVSIHKNGYYTIPYSVYVVLLAGAIQAQQMEIEKLKGTVYGR